MQSYCCREILKHIQTVREYGDYIKLLAPEATQTLTYVHSFSKTTQKKNNATFSSPNKVLGGFLNNNINKGL